MCKNHIDTLPIDALMSCVMTVMADDIGLRSSSRLGSGLAFALLSAASFGLSGALAKGLLESGWSAGAAVTARIALAALVLLVPAMVILRGRWHLVRENASLLMLYGVAGVAGCQLCYFYAVEHMQVGVALLIEYTAPVAVVVWLWLRRGHRPGPLTLAGALVAALGLVLVLDVFSSGAQVNAIGVLWALGAMLGVTVYFVVSADEDNGLPPMVLAAGGLVVASLVLGVAGVLGLLPMTVGSSDVTYRGMSVPWWLPILGLGLVTAALAYVTGIAAGRRLGARMASFVGLAEVLAALGFAWLLLAELPGWIQLVGGTCILAGVVVVKKGEVAVEADPSVISETRSAR